MWIIGLRIEVWGFGPQGLGFRAWRSRFMVYGVELRSGD